MRLANFQRWSGGMNNAGVVNISRPRDAASRLDNKDAVEIFIQPSFALGPDAKFFCIGSCFAREIELALEREKFAVLSRVDPEKFDLTPQDFPSHLFPPNGILTQFNSFSMLQEVERAHAPEPVTSDDFVQMGEEYWDGSLHQAAPTDLETCTRIRQMVDDTYTGLKSADCVIVTLGLTEHWRDNHREIAFNDTPKNLARLRKEDRVAFRNTTYGEAHENVTKLVEKLKLLSSGVKVVITVSPVPLHRTFSNNDIIVANTYSKAILRSVAQDIAQSTDGVDYFPSFEMVMFTNRASAWLGDQRHVNPQLVRHITGRFISNYVKDESAAD